MDTGKLLVVFIIGSFATIAGTLVACKLFPLTALGADGWKVRALRVTSACMALHCAPCVCGQSLCRPSLFAYVNIDSDAAFCTLHRSPAHLLRGT